jgi:hypothetical protein
MKARIDVDPLKAATLMIEQDPLTLTLEDGRTMNFRLANNQTGEIVRAAGSDL